MADNLACIGFSDPDAFSSHFDRIVETLPPPDGRRRTALWRDPSGASLYVHRDRAGSQVECLTPFFAAEKPTLWRVKSSGGLVDTECVHCSGVDVDLLDDADGTLTRSCVQLAEYLPAAEWLREPRTWTLEVAVFAEAIRPFASTGYAENYFLPSGMFGAEQPVTARATVRLAGPLRHAALVENGFTGASFQTLVVDSMTGPTHVVAAEGPLPPVGSVIEVAGWVVGRPFDAV